MAYTISPNMGLTIPGIGTEYSPTWASDLNASLSSVDSHNHSSGQGVQIQPNGMNINADLAFNSNNATLLRSTRYSPQLSVLSGAADVGCLYVVNNELYYNDVTGGHNVQITANGSVNATSSGISSGTASASFSAGVLVVKSSSSSGANVQMQSAIMTNSGNLTNQLTLEAPTLSGSYALTLPAIPVSQSFMAIDTSGNITGYASVSGGISSTNIAAGGVSRPNLVAVGQQISSSCGNFTTSSASFVSVTNLSVTLTTSGRPVMVMLIPTASSSLPGSFYLNNLSTSGFPTGNIVIERGGSIITGTELQITGSSIPTIQLPASLIYLDPIGAGTYTYQVFVNVSSGNTTILGINNCSLVVYEL